MSETGKYPIMMKVYTLIYKYWLRVHNTDNILLKEALKINLKHHRNCKTSCFKIIDYLRKLTNQEDNNNTQTNIDNFKLAMKLMFQVG